MRTRRKFVLFFLLPCLLEHLVVAFQISDPTECMDNKICIIQSSLTSPICVGGFCVAKTDLEKDACRFHSDCNEDRSVCASSRQMHVCVPRIGYQAPICRDHHNCYIHDQEERILCLKPSDEETLGEIGFCLPRLCQVLTDCEKATGWRVNCIEGVCSYSNETLPNRRILVHVDDSLSGKGLEKASVTYQCLNGSTTLQGTEVTRENGLANLTVSPDCSEMKVVVISDGYAEGQAIVPIYRVDLEGHLDHGDERENEERDTEINLSLAPKHFGKDVIIRAVLNWASYRRDLDLHVVAFDPKGQVSCHVSHSKKYCPHMSLDRDNTKTGDFGSETISFTKGSTQKYLVYVKVYPEYRYLYNSGARVTLYSVGAITVPVTLTGVAATGKERIWLVGCFYGSLGLQSWMEVNVAMHRKPISSDCEPIS